jgi:3'-phosphoadenosine 5'-phosphosulfate sulfotransferase (PAPS reductase)/FAD synthetase
MNKPYTICWFSAGVSSAVACKLAIEEIDEVLYIHIDDQHDDTLRFVKDVEAWIGKPITILQHDEHKTVDSVCRKNRYMSGVAGARCTMTLKKQVREVWERENANRYPFRYVWGFDTGEVDRIDRVIETQPEFTHLFPLLDAKMHKQEVHETLKASGIKRPKMYELGYQNNNCIGCIKSQSPAYWNKIRVDFPEYFEARRSLADELGVKLVKLTQDGESVRISLSELDPEEGKGLEPIVDECGILCGIMNLNNQQSRKK